MYPVATRWETGAPLRGTSVCGARRWLAGSAISSRMLGNHTYVIYSSARCEPARRCDVTPSQSPPSPSDTPSARSRSAICGGARPQPARPVPRARRAPDASRRLDGAGRAGRDDPEAASASGRLTSPGRPDSSSADDGRLPRWGPGCGAGAIGEPLGGPVEMSAQGAMVPDPVRAESIGMETGTCPSAARATSSPSRCRSAAETCPSAPVITARRSGGTATATRCRWRR